MFKVGDHVRLKALPPWVTDESEAAQKQYAQCLGGVFTVYGVGTNTLPDGLTDDAELRYRDGEDDPQIGNPHPQTIWVEPEYLELIERSE